MIFKGFCRFLIITFSKLKIGVELLMKHNKASGRAIMLPEKIFGGKLSDEP